MADVWPSLLVFSHLCIHSLLLLKPISSFVFVGQQYLLWDLLAFSGALSALAFSIYSIINPEHTLRNCSGLDMHEAGVS